MIFASYVGALLGLGPDHSLVRFLATDGQEGEAGQFRGSKWRNDFPSRWKRLEEKTNPI